MDIRFLVVDETALDEAHLQRCVERGPLAVIAAVVEAAGDWGAIRIDPDTLAAFFQVLDQVTDTPDFLVDLAFAGSPHLVLSGHPGRWRLGYFEVSLVRHLQPVFNATRAEIDAAVEPLGDSAVLCWTRWRQALDEAFLTQRAVALQHLR